MSDLWVGDVVGKKWQAYGTGPVFFDCWGLMHLAFKKKFNIDLDRHLETPTLNPAAFHQVVKAEIKTGNWVQLKQPEDGCLVLMSLSRAWHHIGMWLDVNGGRLLHSQEGVGVALDNQYIFKTFNRVEFYKHVPVTHPA